MALFSPATVETVCDDFSDALTLRIVRKGFASDHHRHQMAADVCLRVATLRSFLLGYEIDQIETALDAMMLDDMAPVSWIDWVERAAIRLAFLIEGEA